MTRRAKKAEQTDLGNSERFVRDHVSVLRYVGAWEKWLFFDGKRWYRDATGIADDLAKVSVRSMLAEAGNDHAAAVSAAERASEDPEVLEVAKDRRRQAQGALDWALQSHDAARIGAMVRLARSARELCIPYESLDADPLAINVDNGTLDLRTGKLRPHDPRSLVTKLAPVTFDPKAKCPTWEAFLAHAQNGNVEMLDFIRRAVGYCLTGLVRDHVLLFLYGPAGTGKSTFFKVMHELLGDYAVRAPRSLLFAAKGERHPTELSTLHGARFVSCNEIDEGAAFDEALVKDLTGGEEVSTRRMREDFWSFKPSHKLAVGGNYKPRVRNFDDAIRRRVRLIPWTVKPASMDTGLFDKLRAELPGIMAWAVRGCLEWQKHGLGEPVVVRDATDAYQDESDPLGEWFDLQLAFEPDAKTPRIQLRQSYEEYCKENGAEPVKARRFAEALRRREVESCSVRHNGKVMNGWKGVRMATETERESRDVGSRHFEGTYSHMNRHYARAPAQEHHRETGTDEVPTTYASEGGPGEGGGPPSGAPGTDDRSPFASWLAEKGVA